MLKNKVTISATADIPAFHVTSRHRYIALLYNRKTAEQIEQEAAEKKRSYLEQAATGQIFDSNILVNSPPKLHKQYKHGSGLWPSPAFGSRANRAPPPVGRY